MVKKIIVKKTLEMEKTISIVIYFQFLKNWF